MSNKLFIKNMVCNRCIMVVQDELEHMGLQLENISLGEVSLQQEISSAQRQQVASRLLALGFELINDKKSRVIQEIKKHIIFLVHHQDGKMKTNLSEYLSGKMHQDYSYLSNLFSQVEGTTIEKYFIYQRIERVKELLVYDELALSEIAFKLNYSSVAYLSNQFKKVTGLSPSHFKKIGSAKRKPLDLI